MRNCLIAETNEFGHVQWVWVSNGDTRATKPLDLSKPLDLDLDTCETAGAPRAAIRAWLKAGLR